VENGDQNICINRDWSVLSYLCVMLWLWNRAGLCPKCDQCPLYSIKLSLDYLLVIKKILFNWSFINGERIKELFKFSGSYFKGLIHCYVYYLFVSFNKITQLQYKQIILILLGQLNLKISRFFGACTLTLFWSLWQVLWCHLLCYICSLQCSGCHISVLQSIQHKS